MKKVVLLVCVMVVSGFAACDIEKMRYEDALKCYESKYEADKLRDLAYEDYQKQATLNMRNINGQERALTALLRSANNTLNYETQLEKIDILEGKSCGYNSKVTTLDEARKEMEKARKKLEICLVRNSR